MKITDVINIRFFTRILPFKLLFFFATACGTNTHTPVAPFIYLVPVHTPQIQSVIPINPNISNYLTANGNGPVDSGNLKPEFLLRYYVTNSEPQFVGYNLYITSSVPSVAQTYNSGSPYMVDGVQPSFRDTAAEACTKPTCIKTQRINDWVPPPGILPFTKCEIFNFSMRALLNTGVLSNQSAYVTQCAATIPSLCDTSSSCNPASCADASCTADVQASCPVGTLCNPCQITGQENLGCACPTGVSPPGCNP